MLTRSQLLDLVWGIDRDVIPNTVETYVSFLRAKLDSGEPVKLIQTLRGARLRPAGDAVVTTRLARRIQTLAAIEISLVLVAVLLAGALLAFGFYIRTLSNELSGTLAQLQAALTRAPLPDARAGGDFAASLLLGTGSEIVFLDANTRVTVYRAASRRSAPVVDVRHRGDLSGDPVASRDRSRESSWVSRRRLACKLCTRTPAISIIIVKSNDATLVSTVSSFLLPLLIALLIAIACGVLIARASDAPGACARSTT